MGPIFHPSLDEQSRFATPLTDGERQLRDFFLEKLDESWHVFVQPHMLNQQPDFLLVSLEHGVTVIEVKHWREDGIRCDKPRELNVKTASGEWVYTNQDPVLQVELYRRGIVNRFLTPPEANTATERLIYGGVNALVVMTNWPGAKVQIPLKKGSRLESKNQTYVTIVGREIYEEARQINRLLFGRRNKGVPLDERTFNRLIDRLQEPEAIADQRRPLKLSNSAKRVVGNPDNAVIRRVRGSAGSGKTLALAGRAVSLASQGKSVLILSFNITLPHYIEDLVGRRSRELGVDRRKIICIHFHGFCRDELDWLGNSQSGEDAVNQSGSRASEGQDFKYMVDSTIRLYQSNPVGLKKYDAILVDEGQDFTLEWWNFLRNYVRSDTTNGEMLLVADISQDIYGRRAWTAEKEMLNAGFRGPWTELGGSYRLPVDFIPVVAEFASTFIGEDIEVPTIPKDHDGRAAAETVRHWINAINDDDSTICQLVAKEIAQLRELPNGPHEADIVILTETHQLGLMVMNHMQEVGFWSEHIFTELDGQDRRDRKRRFYPGISMLKGSTIQSFKGWEGRAVVYVMQNSDGVNDIARHAYTALTRLKGDPTNRAACITVINRIEEFQQFKPRFEREITSEEVPQLAGEMEFDF